MAHPFRRTARRKPLLPPRPRPVAGRSRPDDDPEFLRDLNRKRREKKDEDNYSRPPGTTGPTATGLTGAAYECCVCRRRRS